MNKTVEIKLTEEEYRQVLLKYLLGNLVKDCVDQDKTRAELLTEIELLQKILKAAYDAKLKGSGFNEGYYYGREIEMQMLDIFDEFKELDMDEL